MKKAWNAFRFAVTSKKINHEVKVFLMDEGVECVKLFHEKYNVAEQVKSFIEVGEELLACGTCLKFRSLAENDVCLVSTMIDCIEMVGCIGTFLSIICGELCQSTLGQIFSHKND